MKRRNVVRQRPAEIAGAIVDWKGVDEGRKTVANRLSWRGWSKLPKLLRGKSW
jgi:hypothetical protein